ncbi:MAG: amino-acid N-acetyltransferase [Treponema sp.]|nr:amino-acid N-acetyltransferase [Treponema sp.]
MNEITSKKAEKIRDVIRYLQKFKNAVVVIYLDDYTIQSALYSSHIRDIALLHEAGLQVVIIPGARKRIDQVLASEGIKSTYHNNIRVTDGDAMPLIKMAAFDVSNTIMTSLAACNINAIIGNWVHARAKGIIDGFDYGTAGEIDKLQTEAIRTILNEGFIPIFPCIGWNSVGHPYNISSVSLAQQIAVTLGADKLFFVMEEGGIKEGKFNIPAGFPLSDNGDVPAMNLGQVDEFIAANSNEKSVISILEKAKEACSKGVTRVHLVDGNQDGVLPCEIFSDLGSGTMIYTSNYGKIRNMVQTDIPAVLGLMRPFIQSGKLLDRNEQQLSEQLSDFVVYEVDGGVHACAALHQYDDKQGEIAAVAVDENFAHMGIGPQLINHLTQKAKETGCKSVFIMTTQTSDWFEKLGFIPDTIESLPEARRKLWTPARNSKVYRLK